VNADSKAITNGAEQVTLIAIVLTRRQGWNCNLVNEQRREQQ
jgi:hypothetical protein